MCWDMSDLHLHPHPGDEKTQKKVIQHSAHLESLLCTEQTPPDVSISDVIYKRTKQLVRLIAPGGILTPLREPEQGSTVPEHLLPLLPLIYTSRKILWPD